MASYVSHIQKALDLAKRSKCNLVIQTSAEKEYAELKGTTDYLKVNNNDKVNN